MCRPFFRWPLPKRRGFRGVPASCCRCRQSLPGRRIGWPPQEPRKLSPPPTEVQMFRIGWGGTPNQFFFKIILFLYEGEIRRIRIWIQSLMRRPIFYKRGAIFPSLQFEFYTLFLATPRLEAKYPFPSREFPYCRQSQSEQARAFRGQSG